MSARAWFSPGLIARIVALPVMLAGAGGAPAGAQPATPADELACPPPHLATAAATPAATPAAVVETRVTIGDDAALLWGAGDYGVVLAHGAIYDAASWRPQAEAIAGRGLTVLAVESIAPAAILAGIAYLVEACGAPAVAVIGASAGGGAALRAAAAGPDALDQLILLSAVGDVSSLGDFPKLFVASDGEGLADRLRAMAETAPGEENDVLILPGAAHAQAIFATDQGAPLLAAIVDRLERFRTA